MCLEFVVRAKRLWVRGKEVFAAEATAEFREGGQRWVVVDTRVQEWELAAYKKVKSDFRILTRRQAPFVVPDNSFIVAGFRDQRNIEWVEEESDEDTEPLPLTRFAGNEIQKCFAYKRGDTEVLAEEEREYYIYHNSMTALAKKATFLVHQLASGVWVQSPLFLRFPVCVAEDANKAFHCDLCNRPCVSGKSVSFSGEAYDWVAYWNSDEYRPLPTMPIRVVLGNRCAALVQTQHRLAHSKRLVLLGEREWTHVVFALRTAERYVGRV